MIITLNQLQRMFPGTPSSTLDDFLAPLNMVFERYQINTVFRVRAFLAQTGHESGEFKFRLENLNYSKEALLRVFPRYFNSTSAASYARKPEKIANRVYANRMGNRDEASGDGWANRGRGLIQITGANNYNALAHALGKTVQETRTYLETAEGAVVSAAWFWTANGLNRWADGQDMLSITRRINGGTNGYDHRMQLWNRSKGIF